MGSKRWHALAALALGALALGAHGCAADTNTGGNDGGRRDAGRADGSAFDAGDDVDLHPHLDVQAIEVAVFDAQPNPDAFFALDPPPRMCGPDGAVAQDAVVPGGTPECPDDKNREGCPCPLEQVGMTAPCWPGLRANRGRGQCHDGVTTCVYHDEMTGAWGPCVGYQLPAPGATLGPAACHCFSMGQWSIADLSPCFIFSDAAMTRVGGAESSYVDSAGHVVCPPVSTLPPPVPSQPWSANTLRVDCVGQFELCYTLRAGNAMTPAATDCVMARVCTSGWYPSAGATTPFPVLPAWSARSSAEIACAQQFATSGGYGEMSVVGLSGECEMIADAAHPYVFNRVNYCPLSCNTNPGAPGCASCMSGGSGSF